MFFPKLTPLVLLLLLIISSCRDDTRASAVSSGYNKLHKHLRLHQWQHPRSTVDDALLRASARRVPNSSDPLHNR